jgi:hypothetical protein
MRNMSLCCHCSIDDEYQLGANEKEINAVCAHRLYQFCQHNIWCKLGFTFVLVEITNKMQPCNRIYYSTVYWRLNMFRAAYRSSSGALTVFATSGLHTHVVTGRSQVWVSQFLLRLDYSWSPHAYVNQRLQIQLELLTVSGVPLETCWAFNER